MKGFTLLPVVLAMSLIAAIAFLLNRDNGINASMIGARADQEHARYAAEAGLQAVNYAIQANACSGGYPTQGAPIADADFGGAAFSAHASSSSGSPLTLTSTGTYNGVSMTLVKAGVHAYQAGVRTWFSRPGPSESKDTSVDEDHDDENYGGDELLELEIGKKQVLIAFDLAPLPPGSRIVRWYDSGALRPGASVSLYQDDKGVNGFSVMLITQNWFAGTGEGDVPSKKNPGATWKRWNGLAKGEWAQGPGNGYDPRTLGVVPYTWATRVEFDVSAAAEAWQRVHPNFGVWLKPFNNTTGKKFASSEEDSWSRRPTFTASYLLPCGASAA